MGLLWCFFLSGNDKKTFQMFQMIIKELYRTLGQMGVGGGVLYSWNPRIAPIHSETQCMN